MLRQTITHLKGMLIFPVGNQPIIVDFFHKLVDEKSGEYHNSKIHMASGVKLVEQLMDKVKRENKHIKQADVPAKVHETLEYKNWMARGEKIADGWYDEVYAEKYGESATLRQVFISMFTDEELIRIKKAGTVKAIFEVIGISVSEVVKDDTITLTLDLKGSHIPYRRDQNIWTQLAQYISGGGIVWNWDSKKVYHSKFINGICVETEWWSTSLTDKLFNKISEFLGEINEYLNLFNPTEVSTQFDNMIVVGN